jgi:hypothetical protein
MQQVMRPYATAGIALVGASMIAITPIAAPLPEIQARPVKLVDAWSDLITDTTTNLQLIADNSDPTAISSLFSELGTNPVGVIDALFDLTPTVDASIGTLPATVNIELPPGLELLLSQIGAEGATFNAIGEVFGQLSTDPSSLLEAPATILNAFLNGEDDISLLNGTINIAGFNGILAPLQDVSINLNLANLLDAVGLGNLGLPSLNLGDLTGIDKLGDLINALGLNSESLGTLLGNPTLGGLLGDLGLGNLGLGSLSLTNLLGLDGDVPLSGLQLDTVLSAFGIDPTAPIAEPLNTFLDALGLGPALSTGLGTELSNLGLLQPLLADVGGVLNLVPGLAGVLGTLGLTPSTLLSLSGFEGALNHDTLASLLTGPDLNLHTDIISLFNALDVSVPDDLSIGGILHGLGFPLDTEALTLNQLLGGLDIDNLSLTSLLGNLDLGDLFNDLGLSGLAVDLNNLTTLPLNLGDLLTDIGLDGNLATINIDGFGGLGTLLADVIPQQILASL